MLYLKALKQGKDGGDGAIDKIRDRSAIANLPVAKLEQALGEFVAPVAVGLPDERLRRVLGQVVRGIVGSQSPAVTGIAWRVAGAGARLAGGHAEPLLPC